MQLREQDDIDMDSDDGSNANSDKEAGGILLEPEAQLRNHRLPLTCVCLDSKDKYAFTASKDGSVIKWCLASRKILNKVNSVKKKDAELNSKLAERRHVSHINAIAISSDDKFLATGGWDKKIRVWSPDNLSWLHSFTLHRREITALAFRRGHHTLYSGSVDKSVMIWTLEDDNNRSFVDTLIGHESPITSMDTSRRERVLTTGGLDQSIRIWKIVEQAQTVFQSKHGSVDVARYIDDKTFVSGGEDGNITLWTTMKRSSLCSLRPHGVDEKTKLSNWVTSLATYPIKQPQHKNGDRPRKRIKLDNEEDVDQRSDENSDKDDESDEDDTGAGQQVPDAVRPCALVASGSCNDKLHVWKVVKNEFVHHQSFDCPGFINDLKFTSDGRKLIAACGKEHRFGRWAVKKEAKNAMRIFELKNIET